MMTPDEILRQADEQIAARKKQESAPQAAMQASEVKQEPRYLSETDMGFDAPARGFSGWARDVGATALKGAIAVPEAAVGLMDIPTGGRVGKFLENKDGAFGFRPKEAKEAVNEWHSDATKQAQQKFQQADGLVDKFGVALENPSLVATAVGESIPSMMAGGVVARGFLGAAKAGAFGNAAAKAADTTKGAVLAGAAGEGATMAGAQASAIRQETEDGLLTPGQSGAALATGAIGAALGYGGGKLADRLGIGNVDTMLAQGQQGLAKEFADAAAMAATNPMQAAAKAKSLPRQVIEGAIVEGVFEELPQSVTETVIQNLALNKPWAEGLDDAIVLGLLSGGAMGGGAAGYKGLVTPRGAGQQQPGQAPDGGAPADVAADPGAPAGAAVVGSISAASQAQEPAQVSPLFDNATAPDPFVNQSAMEAAGFAPRPPEPVLDTQRLDRALAPQKPSEAMGLDPNAGALSAAAALAVDSGASPVAPALPATAAAQAREVIDTDTGEVFPLEATGAAALSDEQLRGALRNAQSKEVRAQVVDEIRRRRDLAEQASSQEAAPAERIAQLQAQADAAEAAAADWGSRDYKPNGMPLPEYEAKGGPADVGEANEQRRLKAILEAKGQAAKANAQAEALIEQGNAEAAMAAQADKAEKLSVAQLAAISRKQIPDMTDGELVALASATAADHPRKEKLAKAVQKRGLQAQAAINEGAKADGTQTDQTQQAQPQQPAPRTAAGQAIDSAPTAAGAQAPQTTPITPNAAPNAGVEQAQAAPAAVVAAPEPRAQRVAQAGQQWAGMTTAQRQEAAARANGIKPVIAKNLPKAEWGKLNADVQGKLADAMGITPEQDSKANEPENQFQSAPEWWAGRSEDDRRLLISVTNRLSGNAFANATTEWDSLSSEQKAFLVKEYDEYVSGGASVGLKAIAKLIARNDGKSSAPKTEQPPTQSQQEPKIKKSDAKALFSGKAMDRTRKAVPADARAMEQFIADGKEAEFQRLLSIRQTGRDNLTDEETNQFYDLRTERNQAKAAVENAGYDRVKPSPPPAQSQQAQAATEQQAAPGRQSAESAYTLPSGSIGDEWRDGQKRSQEHPDFTPTPRQQLLMDAVAKALDDGAFYNKDVDDHVAKTLGVTKEQRARNSHNVEGGDFGYDVYHARRAVEAQAQEAEAAKIRAELNLRADDKLGTLIFNDFKQTNSVEVVSITEDGRRASFKGKRGAVAVTFKTTVPAVKFAIELAHERGKRKDSYEEFIAGRAADKQAAEQPEWRTGRSAVGVEAYAADVAAWNELTPNGRRDAMQRAGVKLPVQVMWENMQSDVRDKMRPAVRAVLADDASATAPANLMQAAKDSGKLEVAHVSDKKPAKKDTKPTKEEIYNAIEAAGGDLPFADQYATVDALNAAVLQAQKNAAAKNPAANANDSPDDWHGSLMKTRAHAKSLIDAGKLDAQAAQAAWSDHDKLLALLDAQEQPNAAMQPEAAKASSTKSDSYGSKNTLVSQSRAEELRAKLREKAKKHLFGGLDTEMMAWGTELAVFHLEAGVRKFSDLVAAMASDLGTTPAKLKPYLRSWYNGARDMMEDHGLSIEGMDNPETVRAELNKLGEQASEQERETQDAGTAVHGNGAAPLERVASEDDAGAARGGPAQPRGTDGEQESSRASGQPDADGDAKARSRGDGSAGNDSVPARAGNGRRGRVSASGGAGKRKRAPGTSATAQELQQEAAEEIKEASAPNVPGIDFAITDELELGKGTESVKFADNLKAIRTLKQIEQEGRRATPEEQRILARYVGWGGLKNAFRVAGAKQEGTEGIAKGLEKRVEEVESLLTPAELRAARNSTTAAHYTSQSVVDAVWKAVQRLGFNGGAVLEPSVGTGNFLGLMPQQLRGASKVFAVEYDSLTARIAQQLYPNQSIIHSGLQNVPLPNGKFALAIGNPPFGKESLYFRHNPVLQGKSIHNQFFLQSLDALAPGGVMGMVVSHNLMDAQDFTARLEMAKSAQFLGAIRLPDTAFKENARTEVVTDIMLFRKRDPLAAARAVKAAEMVRKPGGHDAILESMTPDDAAAVKTIHEEMMRWVPSSQQKNFAGSEHTISVNPYFLANPKMVLGTMDASGTMNNRAELNVRLGNPQELAARLEAAVQQLPQLEPVDDLAGRTLEQFEQMATAMRLAVNRAEPGAVQRDKDGKLKVVLEMDDATGDTRKALLTEIELTKDTPFNEEYTLLTDGKWQRTEDLLDAEGKPVKKLKKDGTPSNLNEKTVVVYDSLAKIPAEDKWGAARIELVSDMLPLRDAFKRQMMLESSDAPAKMIEANRQRLAGLYKDFVKKHGSLHKRTTEKVAMTMPDGALVLALENVDKAGNTTPAEILSKRVTVPPKPAERAKDASEAVAVALAESGEIDIERIAQLLGTDTAGAEAALSAGDKPRAFFDPETNRWEPADGYLSGMVRRKLLAAKAAGLEANVKALEAVQPELWDATQITPAIGASWVPAEVYADFLKHLGFSKVTAHYSKTTNTFSISTTGKAKPEWTVSEQGLDTEEIVQRLLNSRAMKVMRKDADGKQYVDQEGTAESQMKAGEIANEFMDWAFSDDERRERLVGIFNEKYNTRVMRQRDGSHLMLPGKVPDSVIKMRPWQLNAVWRGITDNAVLYDHAVGAGKTFTAIARIMERRRMGLSKKPMVVVPNHLVEQWAADVRKLYPGANILAATKNDFEKARRRRLFARIGSGDYDMVIVGHSSFGFIDIDPSTEERYLDEELRIAYDAVQEAEEAAERDGYSGPGKPLGVAQAERLVKKLEERLAKVRDTNRDRLLTFEEMGIDDLTVDEAHEFKNLAYSSNLAGISGMGNKTGSQKALDLNLKIRSLKERQGTSVAFLTGTPISNSVSEMYLVLRNLMPQEMAELGFENFDAWRTNYVSAAAAYEPTEAGGVKEVTRLGREWSNMRSLMELYYTVSDAVTLQDMKDDFAKANPGKSFPVPKVRSQLNGGGDREMVAIKPNEQQRVILRDVVSGFEGLDGIKNLKERNATRLRLMDRARKVSLDARAVDPNIKVPDGTGKIGAVVGRVFDLYNQWESDKGTQLIFLDRSVPKTKGDDAVIKAYDKLVKEFEAAQEKNDEKAMASVSERLEKYDPNEIAELRNAQNGGWNAYDEIKRQLVAKGIPANEIRFVQEANTDIQKAALFADVNAGRVRVLIGSSPRMGAGTNVQERLVALHHVDVTWKPSDIEQREGRIVRQGNELLKKYGSEFAVDVIAYATEMTVDAKMWSLNATKLKAINGVRKYDGSFNMEFEDEESASMAEMAALATGNPLMVERVVLDGEIKKLEMAERGHLRRVNGARSLIRKAQQTIEHGPRRIELLRSFAKTLESNLQGIEQRSKQRRITIAGEVFTSDEAAMQAVNASIDTQRLAAGNENARYVVEINGEKLTNLKSITNAVASAFGDPGFEAEVNGVKYIDIGQTARAIMELHGDASKRGREFTLSGIRVDGMDVELDVSPNRWNQEKTDLTMAVLNGEGVTVFTRTHTFESPVLTTPSVNAGLVKLLGELQPNMHLGDAASLAKEIDRAKSDLPALKAQAEKPFAQEQDIKQKRKRLEQVISTLSRSVNSDTESAAPVAQTETEAFKRWFGNSKVVDENGKPLVMYHGTGADFSVFDDKKRGSHTREVDARQGFFLTSSPEIANEYAEEAGANGGANIMPAYVSLQNPLVIDEGGRDYDAERFRDYIEQAQEQGHDGVLLRNTGDGMFKNGRTGDTVIAFRSEQIKSAAGNNGSFDPASPDITNFAANPARRPGSAQDKAVMQAIADGKSARDVLRLVANGSKDPFLRQVARLLLKAGITPNIQFGYIGKTKKGNPIYGQYRGKSDTIAIAGSAEYAAERIFMHEAMHAATMRALAKPGLPRLQLQKLLEHVRKNGGAAGFYGLKNVDEFVAEVFTNPDFQAALRTMSAPAGSPLKSAWHSFVQVLRRILGLGDNSTSVLSQALELGVAAVRQDMLLRRQGARASGRANFDPEDPDILNFGTDDWAVIKKRGLQAAHNALTHPGKMSLWDKTVGTMRHIAERYPAFKPVYDAAQQFIDDVASLANTAANVAPRLIPRVDSLRDMLKKPISVDDNKAIAKALFEGTLDWGRDQHGKAMPMDELRAKYAGLNVHQKAEVLLAAGKVPPQVMAMWRGQKIEQFETLIHNKFESVILKPGAEFSDKELKEFFNLNGEQISLYKEARATVAKSLDITARAEMMRHLGHDFDHLRAMVLDAPSLADAWKLLDDELESRAREVPDSRDLMADKMFQLRATVDRVQDLLKHGYMPLSRFGKYTLEVIDQDGERVYFGLFESQADSNRMALQMRNVYKGAKVTQGTMNDEKYKLFAGITPETVELFGNMLGLDEEGQDAKSKAFQEYLRMAKNNHSALKRLIHRKGTAGYSEDVGRVLASFVYSNARLAATGLNAGRMEGAIQRLNTEHKEQGELGKIAMQLREYIQDPQEEGLWLRGMLFAQYLGGSIASALVNTTQPFAVTIPWLSQYGGMAKASAYMAKAVQDMGKRAMNKGSTTYEADLAAALKQAEDDGVVSPQEIHQLMAQARGAGGLRTGDGTKLGNARAQASNYWEKVKVGWGQPFALAEQFNRRSTFIAAYRLAKDSNMGNPAEFARRAVLETQFVYTKANKPQWARGTIGGTLFTFKTYSVSYLELLQRMWTQGGPDGKRAVAWAIVMLMLMGGAGGLPFMEDAEDLIDGMGQMMGYNISAKGWRKEAMADVLGQELAGFLEQGLSGLPGAPIDVSGRLGMGNLIPGTGLFLNKQSNTRDVVEMMGPAGDLVSRGFTAGKDVLAGVIGADLGRIGKGAMELAPNAVRNAAKGVDMMASGMYKDTRGNKIIDTTFDEALWKMIGFQPGSVAQAQEGAQFQQRTRSFYTQTSNEIRQEWARAVFNKDERALERVRERLAAWNEQNPELQIRINMADILKRVNNMKKDRAQRMADTAPRAMRQQMQEWAAQQR